MSPPERPDPFEKSQYRKLFAWSDRLQREWPWLESVLTKAPNARVLDLGCGSGEHSAFLQQQGFDVTGVDSSPKQIESAREHEGEAGPRFVLSTIEDLSRHLSGGFGAALCLGNVLPYLDAEQLDRAFAAISSQLRSEAPLLLQVVNYAGLRAREVRTLPVNVRPGDVEDEEIVLVRLLRYPDEHSVLFSPATLRWQPESEPPVGLDWSRTIRLRVLTSDQLVELAQRHGLRLIHLWGGVQGEAFDPVASHDIVLHFERS